MMVFYVDFGINEQRTAGSKAPADIAELCRQRGYKEINVKIKCDNIICRCISQVHLLVAWIELLFILKKNDIIICQHPYIGRRASLAMIPFVKRVKKCSFIGIIHDIDTLRFCQSNITRKEAKHFKRVDRLLHYYDIVISHNPSMSKYLISKGIDEKRIVNLGIFDYLTDCKVCNRVKSAVPTIAIAGNLSSDKSGYIYMLDKLISEKNSNLHINLYGVNYQDMNTEKSNISYHGSFLPEELPSYLVGDFGLVWDGNSLQTCNGHTGYYLRYNNPHKASLYLASGMPVIVWNESALRDFVVDNKIGICVSSLGEIEEKIRNISPEEYDIMCRNVDRISIDIRNGAYFYNALDIGIARLEEM